MTLAPGQAEIGGLVIGTDAYPITQIVKEKPATRDQDVDRPRADGVAFGRDRLTGATYAIDMAVNRYDAASALDDLAALEKAWIADDVRTTPGEVTMLRVRTPGRAAARVVYGRPRRFSPARMDQLDIGVVPVVADFQAADHLLYSDEQQSLTVSGVAIQHRNAVNLVRNPSFEVDTAEWSPSGCTLATSDVFAESGTQSLEITPDGGVDATVNHFTIPVAPDGVYTLSGHVFTPSVLSVPLRLRVTWFDGTGGFLAVDTLDAVTDATTPVRLSGTATAPDGAATAAYAVDYDGIPTASDVVYVDAAMFVESPELIDYFDGDSDSAFWTGTPHNSTSQLLSGGVTVPTVPPVTLSETFVQSTLVTNGGNDDTWPVFVIRGPRHQPRVRYVGGGDVEFWLDVTLARDQTVTVDPRPWSRRVTRSDGANLAGAMRGTRLSAITLPPGDTELAFRGDDETGLSSLTVQWRDAHTSL